MYEDYWGLKELPFENVPDPRFFYRSPQHEEALMRLVYALKTHKGAAMLTGEVGCGKTLISRVLIKELIPEKQWELALIAHPTFSPVEFLKEILYQLRIDKSPDSKVDLLHHLNDEMVKNMREGRHTIIVVDEAQSIDDMDTFEELRLLLNFQLNERFLLTLILMGQPELKRKIAKIPQLEQRIALRYHLGPLDLSHIEQYIAFRLRVAGSDSSIFTEGATKIIYEYSQGVPRKINNICDLSLLVGFSKKLQYIDANIITGLAEEVR